MVVPIIVRNVLTRTPTRLFIEQSCLFNLSEQIWWNKVVKVIQICFSCSMLCTDGLLLHLVGKRQLLVYSWASYGNGKLGDSIWESHHKSIAQGARKANPPPQTPPPPPQPGRSHGSGCRHRIFACLHGSCPRLGSLTTSPPLLMHP